MTGKNNQPRWTNALWSNTAILDMMTENTRLDADGKMVVYRADATGVCKHLRDDYERHYRQALATIVELREMLHEFEDKANEYAQRIDSLEAECAHLERMLPKAGVVKTLKRRLMGEDTGIAESLSALDWLNKQEFGSTN